MSAYDLLPCDRPNHPDCNIAHERLKLEAKVIRGLIRGLKEEGWRPSAVDDGGEIIQVRNETQAMDAVFAVDESWLTFEHPSGTHHDARRHSVQIVLGNGVDCIPAYGMSRTEEDGWNALMERLTDELYDKYDA